MVKTTKANPIKAADAVPLILPVAADNVYVRFVTVADVFVTFPELDA